MMRPMRTPIVPSRYHTLVSCLNTSALTRMENPMIPPTSELNPGKKRTHNLDFLLKNILHKVSGWGFWRLSVEIQPSSCLGFPQAPAKSPVGMWYWPLWSLTVYKASSGMTHSWNASNIFHVLRNEGASWVEAPSYVQYLWVHRPT